VPDGKNPGKKFVIRTCANISQAWSLLGYEPKVPFEEGIRSRGGAGGDLQRGVRLCRVASCWYVCRSTYLGKDVVRIVRSPIGAKVRCARSKQQAIVDACADLPCQLRNYASPLGSWMETQNLLLSTSLSSTFASQPRPPDPHELTNPPRAAFPPSVIVLGGLGTSNPLLSPAKPNGTP
jgi:hypothetical protein